MFINYVEWGVTLVDGNAWCEHPLLVFLVKN